MLQAQQQAAQQHSDSAATGLAAAESAIAQPIRQLSSMAPKLLVELAPGRPASGDVPEAGPIYTAAISPDGIHRPAGINTCYDLFK